MTPRQEDIKESSAFEWGIDIAASTELAGLTDDRSGVIHAAKAPQEREDIRRRDQIYSTKDRRTHLVRTSHRKVKSREDSKGYVLQVRRIFSNKGVHTDTVVDIEGQVLRDFLISVHDRNGEVRTEGVSLNEDPPSVAPNLLFYSKKQLEKRLTEEHGRQEPDNGTIYELEAALRFIREDFNQVQRDLDLMLPKNQITFDYLWTLFSPGTLVISHDLLGELCGYLTKQTKKGQSQSGALVQVVIGEALDFDGTTKFGSFSRQLEIGEFAGAQNISDLPVFPLTYHPDSRKVKSSLLRRGQQIAKYFIEKPSLYEYSGLALRENESRLEKFNSHGRVMIDPATYLRVEPNNRIIPYLKRRNSVNANTTAPRGDQIMTLPSTLYGFSFGDKIWGAFVVDRIREVDWDEKIYRSLVMPEEIKEMMRQLISAHGIESVEVDDFVRDKGKGLVGLLMGPPGLGKSLTAEAIAEYSKKPLYIMSSGELGHTPQDVNENLIHILELTRIWNAVLLLDEADVFLAKRTNADLQRNAITSIFLRVLEYHPGILILTTNLFASIDEAFQSRIHFSHCYPELTPSMRMVIWERFMEKAREDRAVEILFDQADLRRLSETLIFNGRQIKNAMSVSLRIARAKRVPLTIDAIIKTSQALQQFPPDRVETVPDNGTVTDDNAT